MNTQSSMNQQKKRKKKSKKKTSNFRREKQIKPSFHENEENEISKNIVDRIWYESNHSPVENNAVKIMTYNTLAKSFQRNISKTDMKTDKIWNARKTLIENEVRHFSPDIVCLQEFEHESENFSFGSEYAGVVGFRNRMQFRKNKKQLNKKGEKVPCGKILDGGRKLSLRKTGLSPVKNEICIESDFEYHSLKEGCAIYFDSKRFDLIDYELFDYVKYVVDKANGMGPKFNNDRAQLLDMIGENNREISLFAIMFDKNSKSLFIVHNAHLYWNGTDHEDVQLQYAVVTHCVVLL